MKLQSAISFSLLIPLLIAHAIDVPLPLGFDEAVQRKGKSYRDAIILVTNDNAVAEQLGIIVDRFPSDSMHAREARILIARIHYPDVFVELDNLINKWRQNEKSPRPRGARPGFLSGMLIAFVKQNPENTFVYVRDDAQENRLVTTNRVIFKGLYQKKIEKYTDAEVQAGIARNAAARQAVLEHFLKFLDEGDAYEQSEMVDLVNRLWGRERIKREKDLAVIDNVPDADALIEAVFKDGSRPEAARMRAAYCLPDSKRLEVRAFMMGVVTNNPAEYKQSCDVVDSALVYLESGADANELAVLKSQTNAPAWKRDKITKTSRAIESRLSAPSQRK